VAECQFTIALVKGETIKFFTCVTIDTCGEFGPSKFLAESEEAPCFCNLNTVILIGVAVVVTIVVHAAVVRITICHNCKGFNGLKNVN
jgi:hypothetical protein